MKMQGTRMLAMAAVLSLGCAGAFAQAGGDTMSQDKMFVTMANAGSEAEIQASQMALKKSKNPEVLQFAQRMVDDHTKLIADMKPFSDQFQVMTPVKLTPSQKQEALRLKSKSGKSFDREYVTAMVADHHKDLGDFKHEADTTSNSDLKATVQNGEAVIQQHTDAIDAIAGKMNIATPPAGQ